jgi:hypothetical protein
MLTPEEFRKYLQLVAELHGYASQIISWVNKNVLSVLGDLEAQKGSAPFTKWPKEVQEAVVAGLVVENLKTPYYSPNAYAMLLKDFLGVYLENPAAYVERLLIGSELTDINIIFERTMFLEFVEKIHKITEFILSKAREVGIKAVMPKLVEASGETIIADMIEKFVEKAYEVTVGINRFTTAVWSLRKITPGYLKLIYGGAPQQHLLEALGFRQLLKTKYVELWGFEDYFTELSIYCIEVSSDGCRYYAIINNVPVPLDFLERVNRIKDATKKARILKHVKEVHKLETIGGAICALNEAVWRYTRRLFNIGSKWFSNYTDLEQEYVNAVLGRLREYEWSAPGYLIKLDWEHYISSKDSSVIISMIYDEGSDRLKGVILIDIDARRCHYEEYYFDDEFEKGYSWLSLIAKALARSEYSSIAKIFYDLMPAIIYGIVDVTIKTRLCGKDLKNLWWCDITEDGCSEICRDLNSITAFFRVFK